MTISPRSSVLCASAAIGWYLTIVPAPAVDPVTFTDVTKESRITFSHVWSPDKKYILESMSGGVALLRLRSRWIARRVSRQLTDGSDCE